MRRKIWSHLRSNAIAYLALFVALGGSAYAGAKLNGKTIKRGTIPGNRLKANGVTGAQIDESSLGQVPSAKNADDSKALAGLGPSGYGPGVVSGSIYKPQNGGVFEPPYGFSNTTDPNFFSVEATAPVAMTIRDFLGEAAAGFTAGESVDFGIQVTPAGSGATATDFCTVSSTQLTCRFDGPVQVPKNAEYRLETIGAGLSGNEAVGFQYRAAVG
jgi:hypothetical protein